MKLLTLVTPWMTLRAARRPLVPARPAPLRLRLQVLLRRGRLDRELADGALGNASAELELRACQLARARIRRRLARTLRNVVVESEEQPCALIRSKVPVVGSAVGPWREALLGIAERLEDPRPVPVDGVGRVIVLVTDGRSPLYYGQSPRSMADFVWWIADGLKRCPPHDWRRPVQFDSDHVSWSCGRCDAAGFSDDNATPPG